MFHKGIEIRSAYSRISFGFRSFIKKRKDITTTNWTENEFVVAGNNVIGIT